MAVKNVVFSIKADTNGFDKDIARAIASVNTLNNELKVTSALLNQVNTSASSLSGPFTKATTGAAAFAQSIKAAAAANPLFRGISTNISNTGRAFTQANNAAQQFGTNINAAVTSANPKINSLSTGLSLLKGALIKIGTVSAIIKFGQDALQAAGNYERLNVAFTTFLGSATLAKTTLQELQAYAEKTPFTATETQQSARILLAYGFSANQLIPVLNQLGSVSSGTQIPLQQIALVFGQVRAAGKLMGQDLLQLVNAGFNPLQEISERTGVSMAVLRKRMADGKISADDIQKSFIAATIEGGKFYNLNEEIGKTLPGRISALSDKFQVLVREIGDALSPAAKILVERLISIVEAAKGLIPVFQLFGSIVVLTINSLEKFGNALSNAFKPIRDILPSIETARVVAESFYKTMQKLGGLPSVITNMNGLREAVILFGGSVDETTKKIYAFKDSFEGFDIANQNAESSTKKATDALEKQKTALLSTTKEDKNRLTLLNQFNAQYKQYGIQVENLENERDFAVEVTFAYQKLLDVLGKIEKRKAYESEIEKVQKEYKLSVDALAFAQGELNRLSRIGLGGTEAQKSAIAGIQARIDANRVTYKKLLLGLAQLQNITIEPGGDDKTKKTKDNLLDLYDRLRQVTEEDWTLKLKLTPTGSFQADLDKIATLTEDTIQNLQYRLIKESENIKLLNLSPAEEKKQLEVVGEIYKYEASKIYRQSQADIIKITEEYNKKRSEAIVGTFISDANEMVAYYDDAINKMNQSTEDLFAAAGQVLRRKKFNEIVDNIKLTQKQVNQVLLDTYNTEVNIINAEEDLAAQQAAARGASSEEINKIEQDAYNKRLAAGRKYRNAVKENNDKTNADITQADKDLAARRLEAFEITVSSIASILKEINNALIQSVEAAISAQERRYERAKEIADKGNAELLQREQKRLDALNKQKAKYVREQQALAVVEVAINSAIAIAKAAAEGGALAPFTIAATLAALGVGLLAARQQALADVGGFETGGYTGDGGKKDVAGVVHKGEYVFTQEKTKRYRSLFDDIHMGRDPLVAKGLSEKVVVINNNNMDKRLERIEKAIMMQKGMTVNIDERGIHGIVSTLNYKEQRIRNKSK